MNSLDHKNFLCLDCGKDTWNEYYMLYVQLWRKINPQINGKLCIKCAEKRLGRKLIKDDFTKAKINTVKTTRTAILKNRLSV